MTLIPPDWEPLGENVGPFGPDELEIREYQESLSQDTRKWQIRMAARREVVSMAIPTEPPARPRDLDDPAQIKSAIAFRLSGGIIRRSFDKERDSLPENFRF